MREALIVITITDTDDTVDIRLLSNPPLPTVDGASVSQAQAFALVAMEAMVKHGRDGEGAE